MSKSGTVTFQPGFDQTKNWFLPTTGFDNNGNLLRDATHTYNWDAENKLTAIDTVSLTFDALGRMVEQARGSSYTQIVYSPTGDKLALMNGQTLQKAFVALPGGASAVYNSSGVIAYYRHADWLGSSRFASTPGRAKYFDVAYAPYGEDYADSGTTDLDFTGQNQDTVSGVYDFLYREYHSNSGRWIQPDPAGFAAADPANPQSWNRYAYVGNMPTVAVDPLGLWRSDVFGTATLGGTDPFRDPGGAAFAAVLQEFQAQAGFGSPFQEAQNRYQNQVDCAFNPGSCPNGVPGASGAKDTPDDDYTITVHCGGSTSDVTCLPPPQAVAGSVGYRFNFAFPGLVPGDQPVGINIWQCAGCAATWRNASGAANTAFVATGVVLAGVPLAGEAATSTAGDLLFSRGTGLLNSNNFLRIGWGWYGGNIIDFLPVGGEVFRVVVGSPNGPIHWHLWPF